MDDIEITMVEDIVNASTDVENNASTEEMEEIINKMIPPNYKTKITKVNAEDEGILSFELEVVGNKQELLEWKKEFEDITMTQYMIKSKTEAGHKYDLNLYARCHRNKYGAANESKLGSKNTNCQSKLQIKVLRPLLPGMQQTAKVLIDFKHNHPLVAADLSRFKKVPVQLEEKFVKLFEHGHSPSSALKAHKIDIVLENPDNYYMLFAENNVCPNYQWVYRLYKKKAWPTCGTKGLTLQEKAELTLNLAKAKEGLVVVVENSDEVAVAVDNVDDDESNIQNNLEASTSVEDGLKNIYEDLLKKLKDHPELYTDAIRKMIHNYSALKTDASIVSALHTFSNDSDDVDNNASSDVEKNVDTDVGKDASTDVEKNASTDVVIDASTDVEKDASTDVEKKDTTKRKRRKHGNGYATFFSGLSQDEEFKKLSFKEKSISAAKKWNSFTLEEKMKYKQHAKERFLSVKLDAVDKYLCATCGRSFMSGSHLKYHESKECGVHLACEICDAPFKSIANLQRHSRLVHAKQATFECPECKKLFGCHSDMLAHHNIHTGVRFTCGVCKSTFSNSSNLLRHKKKFNHA